MENLLGQTEMSTFDFENNQHPLVISTVVKEILKDSSIAELKNCRLVCKDWNYEALRLLKKIEWKSPIQFETINDLNSFVKTYGPCPQNILNRSLDCGQILVPSDKAPEIFFHKILPITSCITGLKVNINIQEKQTFVDHEAFEPLTQSLQHFDVRFIKNDNISLSADNVYPRTDIPSLPALNSVIIRMDGFVKYPMCVNGRVQYPMRMNGRGKYGNRIVHPEHGRFEQFTKDGFGLFESEDKMLVELIQELVTKSPLLSDIHLVMSNNRNDLKFGVPQPPHDLFQYKSISILTNLKRNELEKITHLRFEIKDGQDITHLLNLAKSGLNKLKYICIDFVFVAGGMEDHDVENLFAILEFERETLEYFKVKDFSDGQDSQIDSLRLPALLPKLKVLKLAGNFGRRTNILDLNTRFPNLNEIDFTGKDGFLTQFQEHAGPIVPCVQIKKLSLDNESFSRFRDTPGRLSQWFPNVTQVKYHMADIMGVDHDGCSLLWTMTSMEYLVLKVPLYFPRHIFMGISNPFQFISGGPTEDDTPLQSPLPSLTWLTGLKSLKIKQRRRYGCPEAGDERRGSGRIPEHQRKLTDELGRDILSKMHNLEHYSSDYHCFSQESIDQLKMKIQDFQPGRRLN